MRLLQIMSGITGALALFLSGCSDADSCLDTGGQWDEKSSKCACEISKEDGFCKTVPLPETFLNEDNLSSTIFIQRRGSKKRIEQNGSKATDAEIFNGSFADHLISQSMGLAISVPDHPDIARRKWNFGGCTFERLDEKPTNIYATERDLFGFKSYCEYRQVRTSYVVTKQLNIVAFSILSADETAEKAGPMDYVNDRFLKAKVEKGTE